MVSENWFFSSTAAIFGEPETELIAESHPCRPLNPYGQTKLVIEQMLQYCHQAYGLSSVSLRYFNAAGADPDAELGEAHDPETHLIPNILLSLLGNKRQQSFKIFGEDYPTPDGTFIRDYIHVNDLAAAHILGMQYLENQEGAFAFNLGSENGFSVKEVINACEVVSGLKVGYEVAARRPGDPARLVADSMLARATLGWQPHLSSIDDIVSSAWRWHQSQIE